MKNEKKKYTPEFKMEAVKLITEQGYKTTEAARNLGIHPSLLNRWKSQMVSEGKSAFPGKGRLTPEKEELQKLRKENQRLMMERDILKKAAAEAGWTNQSASLKGRSPTDGGNNNRPYLGCTFV
jgi:transposase